MKLFRFWQPAILVIGSVHMDVLGEFKSSESQYLDKEGDVYCSIGGTAFNIATAMAGPKDVRVSLLTHLRGQSPVSDIILYRLRQEGVSSRYIRKNAQITRDSGFIAHRMDGELMSAVSSMPVEDVDLGEGALKAAIKRSALVIAECNLSMSQLSLVVRLCKAFGKPLLVGGVSESKCQRIKILRDPSLPVAVFAINAREASALLGRPPDSSKSSDASLLTEMASAKHVIVTRASEGWTVFSADGSVVDFEASDVAAIHSTSGAGDALLAGIGHYLATHGNLNWPEARRHAQRFITEALRKRVSGGAELTSVQVLSSTHHQQILARLRSPAFKLGALLTGVVAMITLVLGLLDTAVRLEQSTKVLPFLSRIYCDFYPDHQPCAKPSALVDAPGTLR